MKILTTQNLNSLERRNTPTNNSIPNEIRYDFLERDFNRVVLERSYAKPAVSFKAKGPKNNEIAKKIVDAIKKGLSEIKEKATLEEKKGDDFLKSSFFNKLLDLAENGPVFSALTAAVICIFLRPLAIMALPTRKQKSNDVKTGENNSEQVNNSNAQVAFKGKAKKEKSSEKVNNMYASAQSISSGLFGLGAAFLVTFPFSKAQSKVRDNLHKYLNADEIKKLYPWVKKSSLIKDGKLLEKKFWLDIAGNSFRDDVKLVETLPKFKHISEISKETLIDILKKDGDEVVYKIDFEAQVGKSFNEIKVRHIKTNKEVNLYDVINFDKLGIKIKEEGFEDAQILLKDFDKNYLTKMIEDSKGKNLWGDLDINTVFDEKGVIRELKNWKNTKGEAWKLDLDGIFVSSELETLEKRPRISGKKRFDAKEQEWKFVAYQPNGENGKLGTEITNEMLEVDREIAAKIKSMTWAPDLVFRVPVAIGTIAVIPIILKNVFGLEKAKTNNNNKVEKNEPKNNSQEKDVAVSFKGKPEQTEANISFKGNGGLTIYSKVVEFLAKHIEAPLLKSETMQKISKGLSKLPGEPTEHMMVLGSAIQSGVYIARTRNNKDMEEDRKKTLMLNQFLCFLVPTVIGYKVNSMLRDKIKKASYRYTDLMNNKIKELKAKGQDAAAAEAKEMLEKLPARKRSVNTLSELATFTLIYRFLSPIAVTPIANLGGDKYLEWKRAKAAKKAQIAQA